MKPAVTWAFIGLLALGISGCQPAGDDATNDAKPNVDSEQPNSTPKASKDLELLSGAVPLCPELTSAARRPYRLAAFRQCQQATTLDERMKNPGCLAKHRMSECMGSEESRDYTLELFKSEEKEALQ